MNIIKTHVAGTSFNNRQGFICYLNAHATDAYVTVRREPNNPFDPNAPIMDQGKKAFVQDFSVVRARHAKNYGVTITIRY